MTKFILIGGYIRKAPDGGEAIFKEFVKGFDPKKEVKILDCVFADPENAEKKFQEDKEKMSKHISNFTLELANEENFKEQIKSSDVLFLRGGDTDTLFNTLKKCGDWVSELKNKTVAGSSAGAMVLAKYSHALIKDEIIEGFGIVPAKVIAHFESEMYEVDWGKALMQLTTHGEDLPLYPLKEGEFVVIEQ